VILINLTIDFISWIAIIVISAGIGIYFFSLYFKENDKKKLIFAIAFIASTISHIHYLFGYTTPEQNIIAYNAYNWMAMPLFIALFMALNSHFFITKNIYNIKFNVFIGLTILCFTIAYMPINSTGILSIIRQLASIEMIIASIYWIIKTHDRSYYIFLSVIIFFMLGGIGLARDITFFPILCYMFAHIFIIFLVVNPFKTVSSDGERVSSFFSIEQQLKTSEIKFKKLFNNIPDAICILSEDGTILEVNNKMAKNLNRSEQEIIGKNMHDILPKKIDKDRTSIAYKALKSGKIQECDDKRDNMYFHNLFIPIEINEKEKNLMIIAKDITLEKKMEIENKKKMIDLRNTELATINIMEDMQETNSNLEQAKNEILNKNEELLATTDELKSRNEELDAIREQLENKNENLIITTEELQAMNQELDVAREQLSDLNLTLEEKVKERTLEVQHLIEVKDEFINQLSHDLKTPITPLNTLLPIIQKKIDDEKINEMLTVCIDKVRYMKSLVTNTLELARMNSPNFEINMSDVDLSEEVDRIVNCGSFDYDANHIKLETIISDDIQVKVDSMRFEELINNIVSNAVKYSPDGGTITIRAEETKDNRIQLSIQDTGMGMSEEQLNHVFDEFYKADESRHDFTSTGLGLSICKKIIEKHQGKIWAESPGIGKGTKIYFTIPKTTGL